MRCPRTIVVGAGIGGLASAALLAARGGEVTLVETASGPGGKIRQDTVGGVAIDAGPTVFTKRAVFDALFASCGDSLDRHVELAPMPVIARHHWGRQSLDLFADPAASEAAIGAFAGADEARGYARFRADARRVHDTLDVSFMRNTRVSPLGLVRRIGLSRIGDLVAIRPYESLWKVLGEYFRDPRLQQLFARYSTYCGSSPFLSPATLMLIAHVEAQGVWAIKGGMSALALAVQKLAERGGARFRYDSRVVRVLTSNGRASGVLLASGEQLHADSVIFNGDPAALSDGALALRATRAPAPRRRSLSAVTLIGSVDARGLDLSHHNVFFSGDYAAEFADLHAGRLADRPTVYFCAPDHAAPGRQRVQIVINAPANGDTHTYTEQEIERCRTALHRLLAHSGLTLTGDLHATTPNDFATRFPATGGALYGQASHGWAASFRRPGARTKIPGLYLAGGGTHPGAGVPMAALSGQLAAASLLSDHASTRSFHPAAMAGGMSTRSAPTVATG